MEVSNEPAKFPIPFAAGAGAGFIRPIPELSQIPITPGAASLIDGFPPSNFLPKSAGGVPPFGQDMNGILNEISSWSQWYQAGGPIAFDSTFQTAILGYPSGSLIQSATTPGKFYLSGADNNVTNPDSGGAGWGVPMAGIVGSTRALVCSIPTASQSAMIMADEIIVETALGGARYCLPSFSKTINLATTGVGGMDTGAPPANGSVGVYAIYNPTIGSSGLLAVNEIAVLPSVYGGANMPAGYTASALVSVWTMNGSSQFNPGVQLDRTVFLQTITSANVSTVISTLTALVLAIPNSAKKWFGWASINSTAAVNAQVNVAADANRTGQQQLAGAVNTSGSGSTNASALGPVPIITPKTIFWDAFVSSGTFTSATLQTSGYEF